MTVELPGRWCGRCEILAAEDRCWWCGRPLEAGPVPWRTTASARDVALMYRLEQRWRSRCDDGQLV